MFKFFAKLIHIATKIFFPHYCVGCGKNNILLCSTCAPKLERNFSEEENIITALAYSDRAVRQLIWLMKYRGSSEATLILAQKLEEAILHHLSDVPDFFVTTEKILLVPVPMTRKHQRRRGWNQALLLAQTIAQISPASFTVSQAVVKVKDTKSQVHCQNKQERLQNLKNAFGLSPTADIAGKIVIVIDDVTTTGTTLTEIMRVLKQKPPRRLYSAAVAHG
ncbi:MAG: hypothetical protein A2571_02940 [Candidatus Vogelbacteria bacterium RIFOXYD1_FULL_44_32]|uniref:Phosphoribosyltransferase domain-containing protein n=1 Tax=Candidatus Vogelbacteria bacterium RIFOXYD1_FULL_44_32 TaxID=1802438 RepID=A0A1G2QDY6_9BACT|nr:MAG: hypothetical protein A2571_02940 [Candidatus Vogelbacteria bacterium RIFOXYD1_FULL_44_32]